MEQYVVISARVDNTSIPRDRDLKFTVTITWNKDLNDISVDSPDTPLCENLTVCGNFFASDTKSTEEGQIASNHYGFILKPENVGVGKIGPVSITYTDNVSGEEKSLATSPIEVSVTKPLSDRLYLLGVVAKYIFIVLIIALLAFFIIKFIRKRREEKERIRVLQSLPTMEERYINELKSVYSKRQTVGAKEYSSEIAQLLKEYLEEKFDLKLTGATTDRILAMLGSIDLLKQESVDLLISIFDFCDNVKFAGSEASRDDIDNLQFKAESFISSMKDLKNSDDIGEKDERGNKSDK